LNLAVISRIRDEQDIVALFLAHLKALFDLIIVIDHRSVDSTRTVLDQMRKHDGFVLYSLNTCSNHPKQVTHLVLNEAFSRGADAVFFLDADEFVEVQSREALENLIQDYENQVLELKWKNTVISGLAEEKNVPTPESLLYVRAVRADLGKVIFSRKLFLERPDCLPNMGNHFILDRDEEIVAARDAGALLHLPFRSRGQFVRKLLRSALDKLSQGDRLGLEGWHYFLPLKLHGESGITDEQLFYMTAHYAEGWTGEELPAAELSSVAFEKKTFKSIALDMDVYEFAMSVLNKEIKPSLDRIVASYVSTFKTEVPNYSQLEINGSKIDLSPVNSAALNDAAFAQIAITENERLRSETGKFNLEYQRVFRDRNQLLKEVSRLEEERLKIQDEARRLANRISELKEHSAELTKTVHELRAEIDTRGEVLDRKRAELVEARTLADELRGKILEKESQIRMLTGQASEVPS